MKMLKLISLLVAAPWGIWLRRRNLIGAGDVYLLPVLFAGAKHDALVCGGMRYHYPFMSVMFLSASITLNEKILTTTAPAAMD